MALVTKYLKMPILQIWTTVVVFLQIIVNFQWFFEQTQRQFRLEWILILSGLWIRIHIHFKSWIWILIQYVHLDPGGKNKKRQEIGNICIFIKNWQVKFDQLYGYLFLSNPCCLFQLLKTFRKIILNFFFFKLDPDLHYESSRIWISIEKNSWIQICKKWMQINRPAFILTFLFSYLEAMVCMNMSSC